MTPTCRTDVTYHYRTVLMHLIILHPTNDPSVHSAYPGTEVVNRLWWETSSSERSQSEESRVVPVTVIRRNVFYSYQTDYL